KKDRLKITTDYFKVNSGEGYNIKHHTAWAISLFRMRVRFIRAIDALIVVGGKGGLEPELTKDSDQTGVEPVKTDELPWGRFPGVAEEAMLALAFKKPVYIIGMLQGAAKDVGILLGLSNTQLYTSSCLPQPSHGEHLKLMSA